MKLKNLIACFFLGFIMVSCIQDEAPNAEADIIACTVPGDVLNRDPIIENKKVTLIVKTGTDITALAPKFTLTQLLLSLIVELYLILPHLNIMK